MSNVISISGAKRSGKDTVTEMLVARIGGAKRVALADPIKAILMDMMGLTYEELEDLKNDENKPHRKYLQNLGQKAKEFFGESCWRDYSRHVIASLPKNSVAVISDVRFPFETQRGDLTINVVRRSLGKNTDTHASENGMKGFEFDITIYNNGTLEELETQVDNLITKLYTSRWLK